MKKILTTFASQEYTPLLAETAPAMQGYADLHGYEFVLRSWPVQVAGKLAELFPAGQEIPPISTAWGKILWQYYLILRLGADVVLWLDADVLIVDGSMDILDALGDAEQGLAWHHNAICGLHPNVGVWVMRQSLHELLWDMWMDERWRYHPWAEQAALIHQLGGKADCLPVTWGLEPSKYRQRTVRLGAEWNWHPLEREKVEHVRFAHAAGCRDRLETVKEWKAMGVKP